MSDTDAPEELDMDWWPTGANHPAFTVQRRPYGALAGGDYVRAHRWDTKETAEAILLSEAVIWIDPASYTGGSYLENKGSGGTDMRATVGSTTGPDTNDPTFLPFIGQRYLYLPSAAMNAAYTNIWAQSYSNIGHAITIELDIALSNWGWSGSFFGCASAANADDNDNVNLGVGVDGANRFYFGMNDHYVSGIGPGAFLTVPATPPGTRKLLRISIPATGGTVTWEWADPGGAYTTIGSATLSGPRVGAFKRIWVGNTTNFAGYSNSIYSLRILYDGAVITQFDPSVMGQTGGVSPQVPSQTWTINRGASGIKSVLVTKPTMVFGQDDYLEVPSNPALNFPANQVFTVLVAQRSYGTFAGFGNFIGKQNWGHTGASGGSGWSVSVGDQGRGVYLRSHGDNGAIDGYGGFPASVSGALEVVGGQRSTDGWLQSITNDHVEAGYNNVPHALSNDYSFRVGRGQNIPWAADFEFYGAAVWRRLLSADELNLLKRYYSDELPTATAADVSVLPQTALRFVTRTKGWNAIADQARLFAMPYGPKEYDTIQLSWGWPSNFTWTEVALVRSGFGRPVTTGDGQMVFHASKEKLQLDYSEDGVIINAPVILDTPLQPGHWYYYSVLFKTTPLDWVVGMQAQVLLPSNHHHAEHLWNRIPPYYQWTDNNIRGDGDGPLRQFLKLFGYELDLERQYIESAQDLYHTDMAPMRLLLHLGQNLNVPYEQGLGDIRYRGLLANAVQLYNLRGTATGLEKMCEAASQYDCEVTPGLNLMMLPDDSEFYLGVGSWVAMHPDTAWAPTWTAPLNTYMETVIEENANENIAPAVGRGTAEVTVTKAIAAPMMHRTAKTWDMPPASQRIGPEQQVNEPLGDLIVCCGNGYRYISGSPSADGGYDVVTKEFVPLYAGIPVRTGTLYGFAIYVREQYPTNTRLGMMWFGSTGMPYDKIDQDETSPAVVPALASWHLFNIQAQCPPDAYFLIPYVRLTGTTMDKPFYLSGAQVYSLGTSDEVTVGTPPDQYLTLGVDEERIGVATPTGPPSVPSPFPGYPIGAPK